MPATLDDVLIELKYLRESNDRLERTVRTKIDTPVNAMTLVAAATRIGKSVSTFKRAVAQGIFTDNRTVDEQRRGCKRMFLSDEIEAFKIDGEAGVLRLREELARL